MKSIIALQHLLLIVPFVSLWANASANHFNANLSNQVGTGDMMFWCEAGSFGTEGKIYCASMDMMDNQNVIVSALMHPEGIQADPANGKLYWTDRHSSKIQRSNWDGSNVEDLVIDYGEPRRIALDPSNQYMYWTKYTGDSSAICRSRLDGSEVEELYSLNGITDPHDIALDINSGKIYWADEGTNCIHRANMDGTGAVENYLEDVFEYGGRGLAIDTQREMIYWVDNYPTNRIRRCSLTGESIEDIVTGDYGYACGLSIRPNANELYWTQNQNIYSVNIECPEEVNLVLSLPDVSGTFRGITVCTVPEPASTSIVLLSLILVFTRRNSKVF